MASVSVFAVCPETLPAPGLERIHSVGWGMDPHNTRHQGPARTRFDAANVSGLALKWVYALTSEQSRSMPLVTEDTIFVGDGGRGLVALDRATGCVRWEHPLEDQIGSAILHQRTADGVALFFAARNEGIFAVDARDGTLLWQRTPDGVDPIPFYSGTPLVHGRTLYGAPLVVRDRPVRHSFLRLLRNERRFCRDGYRHGRHAVVSAHDRGAGPVDGAALAGRRQAGSVRSAGVGRADARCGAGPGVLRYRTELQPSDDGHERRHLRAGRSDRSAPLGTAVHRQRRLQHLLRRHAGTPELS